MISRPFIWKLLGLLAFGSSLASPVASQESASVDSNTSLSSVTMLRSKEFVFHSEHVNDDFLIQVAEPFFPPQGSKTQKLPVIYVTDGSTNFFSFSTPARMLPLEGSTQPAYIVGIGYPTEDLLEQNRLRTRDLVHANIENIAFGASGGGGKAFEQFLVEELKPEIEKRFPVDSDRSILAGYSLGGLFAATVLKNNPTAFAGLMIGSPSIQFDPTVTKQLELMARKGKLTNKIFISVGDNEGSGDEPTSAAMIAGADSLENAITTEHSVAKVKRVTFKDETHMSGMSAWVSHGLRFILNDF